MNLARRCFLHTLCAVALFAPALPSMAQSSHFEINMDELVDDTRNGRVVARGKVEIRYFGEILVADEVSYDRATRKLSARGHVELQEADGKISRAEAMNLTDELRDAFLSYARRQKIRVER